MRRAALLVASLASLALCACESVKVEVNCETVAGPAVDCVVKQTQGKSEVEACWDFAVDCANGTKVVAQRTCQKVGGGATVKTTIPADKLADVSKCDKSDKATLSNLTINGKQPQ